MFLDAPEESLQVEVFIESAVDRVICIHALTVHLWLALGACHQGQNCIKKNMQNMDSTMMTSKLGKEDAVG